MDEGKGGDALGLTPGGVGPGWTAVVRTPSAVANRPVPAGAVDPSVPGRRPLTPGEPWLPDGPRLGRLAACVDASAGIGACGELDPTTPPITSGITTPPAPTSPPSATFHHLST